MKECLGICSAAVEAQQTYNIVRYIGDPVMDMLTKLQAKIDAIEEHINDALRRVVIEGFDEGYQRGYERGIGEKDKCE